MINKGSPTHDEDGPDHMLKSPRRALYELSLLLAFEGFLLFILVLTAGTILYVIGQTGIILFLAFFLVNFLILWVVNGLFATYTKFQHFYGWTRKRKRKNKAP